MKKCILLSHYHLIIFICIISNFKLIVSKDKIKKYIFEISVLNRKLLILHELLEY